MRRGWSWALALATLLVSGALLPVGVVVVGVVLGGLTSLFAIGLVLAFRAHRFINIAHASLGAVAGSATIYAVVQHGRSFWIAFPLGLLLGAVLGVATGALLGGRLADASRAVVLAASIGLAFVFGSAHVALGMMTGSALAFEVPIPVALDVFPVRLGGTHALAALIVPLALVGVWAFLQRSDVGLRVRALAGNARHAKRIGVEPRTTWRLLWAVIGILAAAGGIASQPLLGTTVARGPLIGPLLIALASAAVGRMRDLPLTVGASVALGVAYQAILWRSPVAAFADIGLLVVLIAALAIGPAVERLDERRDPARDRLVRMLRPGPQRTARLRLVARIAVTALATVAAVIALPRLGTGDAQRVGSIAVFALAGLSVHILATYRGLLNLGVWAFVGIGSTVAAAVGGGSIAGALTAAAVTSLLAIAVGMLTLRRSRIAYPAVTLAIAFAFASLVTQLPVAANRTATVGPLDLFAPGVVATIAVVITLVLTLAISSIRRTGLGRAALAMREDPRTAAVHGVRTAPVRLAVDGIAGAIAGLAGALYLWNQRVIHPDAFDAVRSIELLATTIVGGLGSALGPLVGSVLVKGAEFFADGPAQLLATGIGLLVVVLWLRGGVVSIFEEARGRLADRDSLGRPQQPDGIARFCPSPSAETRKARHDPIVRNLATTTFLAGAAGGPAIVAITSQARPATAIWILVSAVVVGTAGSLVGFRLLRTRVGTLATFAAAALAVVWTPAAVVVCFAAGAVTGSALRGVRLRVPQPLVHAASGWVTALLLAGVAIGAVLGAGGSAVSLVASAAAVFVAFSAVRRPFLAPSTERPAGAALALVAGSVTIGGTTVLRDSSFEVKPGEIVGLVGANGVGKTTLLRAFAGEVRLSGGHVFVRHLDATVLTPEERYRLGLLLADTDDGSNGELTVRENLRLAALGAHPRGSASDVVLGIAQLHTSLAIRLDDPAAVLSGGERRLLALAQVVAAQPTVLLVDELSRGLSVEALATYRATLRELAARGTAIVVVDHDRQGLRAIADRVVRLVDTRLVDDVEPAHDGEMSGVSS